MFPHYNNLKIPPFSILSCDTFNIQVLGLVNDINLLQDDKKVLRNELDDEKRKVEDLQFQLEENELMRGETDTAGGVEKQELSKQMDELKTKLIQEEADHTLSLIHI